MWEPLTAEGPQKVTNELLPKIIFHGPHKRITLID